MKKQPAKPRPIWNLRRTLRFRVGATTVPIYQMDRGNHVLYLVSLPGLPGGPKRRRRWFSRLDLAQNFARNTACAQPEKYPVLAAFTPQGSMRAKQNFAPPNAV